MSGRSRRRNRDKMVTTFHGNIGDRHWRVQWVSWRERRSMYNVPDVDEVVAVAAKVGIHISADEAGLYQKYLAQQLGELDAFVQSRLEECKPPMVSPSRRPGYRPSAVEDPLNAWTWKCRIEGAPGGLLAGKTVSYKDHT